MIEKVDNSRSGFIAIVGRPNVGKSTLLNKLIGEKISITANKPQTTRHRILGIKTIGSDQLVYIDTPGMHKINKKAINREMNKAARSAMHDVDAVIFVVSDLVFNEEDEIVLELCKKQECPVFLVINKIDKLNFKSELLPHIEKLSKLMNFKEVFPISATKGTQVEDLEKSLLTLLPAGPHYFYSSQVTDKSDAFRIAEIIREKLTRALDKELPYALTVEIEKIEKEEAQTHIHAIIWVERESQKGIVIGKGGANLKEVGQKARLDMNKAFDVKIHLELWVKVRSGWSDDEKALQNLGYIDLD